MRDGLSFYFHWYTALPAMVGYVALPGVVFSCYCRCLGRLNGLAKWLWCGGYVAASGALAAAECRFGLKGCAGLVFEAALLALWGKLSTKRGWRGIFAASVLVLSVLSVVDGIVSWADQRIFASFVFSHEGLVYASDGIRELIKVLAVLVLFGVMVRRFGKVAAEGDERAVGWMTVPMFFIAMVERIIRHSIYGDSLVYDQYSGTFSSIIDVNHGEMLFLQVFACICLFLALFACEKILHIFRDGEKLRMLRQQAEAQEVYVREAAMRYKQTQSFRHDIKNHLLVLEGLLRDGRQEQARHYLSQVKEAAEGLSWEVSTGNGAVDALLGSKLALARQEGIRFQCDVKLPEESGIKDMDWCILLANGLDNAIKALRSLEPERRHLKVEGRRKGNFYLLSLENGCSIKEGEMPGDGIGLSNIRAVAEAYNGRVEKELGEGVYRLRVLLLDSRQEKGR